jgi:hypothetical protein
LWHHLSHLPFATKLPFFARAVLVSSHACGLEASIASNGEERLAEQTDHYIQFDQPELAIEAINHVLEADRTRDLIQ